MLIHFSSNILSLVFLLSAEASIKDTTSRPHVVQMRHAGSMQPMHRRDAGVWHQTRSLLYKNLLIKWRTKQQSLQVLDFQKTDVCLFRTEASCGFCCNMSCTNSLILCFELANSDLVQLKCR